MPIHCIIQQLCEEPVQHNIRWLYCHQNVVNVVLSYINIVTMQYVVLEVYIQYIKLYKVDLFCIKYYKSILF